MASGRQISKENVKTFNTWLASKTDDDFRGMESRGVLSRTSIAMECGFAKSSLGQNPRIKTSLRELEDSLRERGVLPPAVEKSPEGAAKPHLRDPGNLRASLDSERLSRLETAIASLQDEVSALKRSLEKHSILSEALALRSPMSMGTRSPTMSARGDH